jgi:hypothetical protein
MCCRKRRSKTPAPTNRARSSRFDAVNNGRGSLPQWRASENSPIDAAGKKSFNNGAF